MADQKFDIADDLIIVDKDVIALLTPYLDRLCTAVLAYWDCCSEDFTCEAIAARKAAIADVVLEALESERIPF